MAALPPDGFVLSSLISREAEILYNGVLKCSARKAMIRARTILAMKTL
jgi:hypothetical protein